MTHSTETTALDALSGFWAASCLLSLATASVPRRSPRLAKKYLAVPEVR